MENILQTILEEVRGVKVELHEEMQDMKQELREELDSKISQQSREIAEELQQIVIMQERRDEKFQNTLIEM